jgi:hypothetical protein
LLGTFTGGIIRLISDIRLEHGRGAVNFSGCGRFVLAENLSGIADITHIDLSGIGSLEGTCVRWFCCQRRLESPVRIFPHPSFSDQSADDASANVPQVTLLSWKTAKTSGPLTFAVAATSPVRTFPHTSFADQSADDASAKCPLTTLLTIDKQCDFSRNSAFVSLGIFTGCIIRLISDIRLKHGRGAVDLSGCGRFMLADDLSDIADITHIDLSGIDSLKGTCVRCLVGSFPG